MRTRRFLLGALAMAGAAVLAGVVVLLALVLQSVNGLEETLRSTNERLDGANARIERTRAEAGRIDARVEPLSRSVPEDVRAMRPDVDAIATGLLPSVTSSTRSIADAVLPLAEQLEAADPARLAANVDRLAAEALDLLARRPLGETVSAANALLADVRRRGLVAEAQTGLRELPRVTQRLTQVERDLVTVHEVLVASRRVQCHLLERIASVDRKTGGELPPDGAPEGERPPECRDVEG